MTEWLVVVVIVVLLWAAVVEVGQLRGETE